MNKLEFACFFSRLMKKNMIFVDSEVVAYIYDIYAHNSYDKYTIFELIDLFDTNKIYIGCFLNKSALLQYIKDKDINFDLDIFKTTNHTTSWQSHIISYMSYSYYYNTYMTKCIIIIKNLQKEFIICEDDVYVFNQKRLKLKTIHDDNDMLFIDMNISYYSEVQYTIKEFIDIAQSRDDFTIEKNKYREGNISLNFKFAIMQIKK